MDFKRSTVRFGDEDQKYLQDYAKENGLYTPSDVFHALVASHRKNHGHKEADAPSINVDKVAEIKPCDVDNEKGNSIRAIVDDVQKNADSILNDLTIKDKTINVLSQMSADKDQRIAELEVENFILKNERKMANQVSPIIIPVPIYHDAGYQARQTSDCGEGAVKICEDFPTKVKKIRETYGK